MACRNILNKHNRVKLFSAGDHERTAFAKFIGWNDHFGVGQCFSENGSKLSEGRKVEPRVLIAIEMNRADGPVRKTGLRELRWIDLRIHACLPDVVLPCALAAVVLDRHRDSPFEDVEIADLVGVNASGRTCSIVSRLSLVKRNDDR